MKAFRSAKILCTVGIVIAALAGAASASEPAVDPASSRDPWLAEGLSPCYGGEHEFERTENDNELYVIGSMDNASHYYIETELTSEEGKNGKYVSVPPGSVIFRTEVKPVPAVSEEAAYNSVLGMETEEFKALFEGAIFFRQKITLPKVAKKRTYMVRLYGSNAAGQPCSATGGSFLAFPLNFH